MKDSTSKKVKRRLQTMGDIIFKIRQKIRYYVIKNLDSAFELLNDIILPESDLSQTITLLNASYKSLKINDIKGIMTFENKNVLQNQIIDKILNLSKIISAADLDQNSEIYLAINKKLIEEKLKTEELFEDESSFGTYFIDLCVRAGDYNKGIRDKISLYVKSYLEMNNDMLEIFNRNVSFQSVTEEFEHIMLTMDSGIRRLPILTKKINECAPLFVESLRNIITATETGIKYLDFPLPKARKQKLNPIYEYLFLQYEALEPIFAGIIDPQVMTVAQSEIKDELAAYLNDDELSEDLKIVMKDLYTHSENAFNALLYLNTVISNEKNDFVIVFKKLSYLYNEINGLR